MPKYENPTKPLDADGQALVAALTAAILAARDNASAPSPFARAAADQYARIKNVLLTHGEALERAAAQQS